MPFIGLTGGIGTGKTTVLNCFKNFGAFTLNADSIVHDLLKDPAMISKLSRSLGKDIVIKKNNRLSINKNRMADVIFTDSRKRRFAERTIHPEVIKTALNKKTKIQKKKPDAVIVFEVPLLFEAGYKNIFDKIIVVYCDKQTALKRLAKRGLSKERVLKRMRAQIPLSRIKSSADFLIHNNSTIRNLKTQVQIILKKLIQ